ncbi:Gfo/Idh/MocA family oxidoreductase [Photobacterium frigidiphilum]|uniref:Gfo/Idh/MocA family oxidoreductase n=1 Tax=Photobacterium frigidiphilum TaxID=264736 RepID=UPI003D0A07AE
MSINVSSIAPSKEAGPLRIVVCGTTFGRIYMKAIAAMPTYFRLVGIVARGSTHSKNVAASYGVPLYKGINELPTREIDAACVVVRAGVVGGVGADLALALLKKRIPVLQEHPLHLYEISQCLQAANAAKIPWSMNSFYPDVSSVRGFIRYAKVLRKHHELRSLMVTCSVHVLYPLIDILSESLGGLRPWSFSEVLAKQGPFTLVAGGLAGIPITFEIQNQMAPNDPDNHTEVLHRITLTTDVGTLLLTDTHGSVLWTPRLHVPRDKAGQLDMFNSEHAMMAQTVMQTACTMQHEDGANIRYSSVFEQQWPLAMQRALARFYQQIVTGKREISRQQTMLSACQCWQDLSRVLGPVTIIEQTPPRLVGLSQLEALCDEQ